MEIAAHAVHAVHVRHVDRHVERKAPTAIGRYRIEKPVGSGNFGTVYLAHDTQLDRNVAIKVLRDADVSPAETERFLEEARRLARLQHAGIVIIHDVGVHEDQPFIVSDFLDGPSLRDWLNENRPSWREAARIAADVADALAHAHARLTIHRDIKPSNIILTRDRKPVLVDFGLGLDESKAGGQQIGMISGTPQYMSPEQVSGSAHRIDGRTDIYGLGAVLYEMLCGRLPFRSEEIKELIRQIQDDDPQPLRQLAAEIPPELEHACLKAMAKRQNERYTTAADFAADLRRVTGSADPASERSTTQLVNTSTSTALPSSQRRIRDAERRQVTVLVCGCELFESEAYVEKLDSEDQSKVLAAFQQTCEQAARRFDGTILQCNEQGVLICFGYPLAFEDAPHRAVRTGLGILADIKSANEQLSRDLHVELKPWVGIHSGPAVAETKDAQVSVVGEARNVAVRLQEVAEPGEVVCSAATRQLVAGQFESESLGERKLKGIVHPVELFRLHGGEEIRNPVEAAAPSGLTPLTGRDHEVSLLKDRWEQAQEGMGQVVLIVGEPGLGKSRLVYTLKSHVMIEAGSTSHAAPEDERAPDDSRIVPNGSVLEWRCSPHYQNTGLFPASDFFERFLGFGRQDAPAAKLDRLIHHLAELDLAQPDVVPLFASLLSLPLDDRFPSLSLSPFREREETFRVLREWLRAYSARRPVLFIVEDLHWMDASTVEFLKQFMTEGLHERVLTLLTFRPEFQTPWPAVSHQTSIALNRLTRRQVEDVMRKKIASEHLSRALVDQMYARTGGVPLFVEEFTRMVQESGALDQLQKDGSTAQSLLSREVPATLQDLVMARLDRIAGDREVAQLAATLGREFSFELIAKIATLDEQSLQAELARLVQAELLYQKGQPPRSTYTFKHALLEDAARNSLVKTKRQQFHRRIAEVMEAQFPLTVEVKPELLAHHFTEAGLAEKGVGYWLKAGLRSHARSAAHESIGHLTQGLAQLASLPESPERDARELEFLNPLGTAYIAARGYGAPEVGPVFHRARELCERIGEPPQLFAMMWGIWVWNTVRADLRLCMKLSDEAVAFAERVNDPGMIMEALFLPAVTLAFRGEFAPARAVCERALTYDDRERTRRWAAITGEDSGVAHRCYLSVALWHLGHPDEALKLSQEALDLARSMRHPFTLAFALEHRAWLCNQSRLAAEARAAADEEIRIAAEQGFAYWLASATLFKADALVLNGQWAEALPILLKGLNDLRATGTNLDLTMHLGFLGDALARAGRFEDSAKSLDEAMAVAEANDERFFEPELRRIKAELLLTHFHDEIAAEECLQRAIETARRQQSKAWEMRATTSLARLWQQQNRRADAREALATIFNSFTEGFKTPDLLEAKALLEALA